MAQAKRTIVIDRPQAEVFAFFAEAENDPQWRSGVKQIKRVGELAVGARYTQRISGPAGLQIPADIEVTAYEPDVKVAFRGVAGPVRPDVIFTFEPASEGTSVTFSMDAVLTGFVKLVMGKQVQKTMDAEVASLDKAKAVLESGG
jgi:uncharacterized membrane protein